MGFSEALQRNWKEDAPIFYVAVDRAATAARRILDRLIAEEQALTHARDGASALRERAGARESSREAGEHASPGE